MEDHYIEYARKELSKALEAVEDSDVSNHVIIADMIRKVIRTIDGFNADGSNDGYSLSDAKIPVDMVDSHGMKANDVSDMVITDNVSNDSSSDSNDGNPDYDAENVFKYLHHTWVPVRKIRDKIEARKIDEFKHPTDYSERTGYSYDAFYDSTSSNADIFKCLDDGRFYTPGNFTLYDITDALNAE